MPLEFQVHFRYLIFKMMRWRPQRQSCLSNWCGSSQLSSRLHSKLSSQDPKKGRSGEESNEEDLAGRSEITHPFQEKPNFQPWALTCPEALWLSPSMARMKSETNVLQWRGRTDPNKLELPNTDIGVSRQRKLQRPRQILASLHDSLLQKHQQLSGALPGAATAQPQPPNSAYFADPALGFL